MKFSKNITTLTGLLALSLAGASVLASCGGSGSAAEKIYTINFVADGARPIQPIKAKAGEKVTPPDDPYRSGYVFVDWHETYHKKTADYAHSATEKAFDFSSMPARNVTLYAHFEEESGPHVDDDDLKKYIQSLKDDSQDNHLYYHYYRYGHVGYEDWDVWAWPYKPTAGEGARIDWVGCQAPSDRVGKATGEALYDPIGGAYADIDLGATYQAGWNADKKEMLNIPMTFEGSTQIGLQIVRSETRTSSSGFWVNDGSNVYISLEDYRVKLTSGGTAYHVFVVQDKVYSPQNLPVTERTNPFDDDDGTNVTFGNSKYDDVPDWDKSKFTAKTADDFTGIGAGYQIQVSSFADSDGDGFGDILGITQKMDYIAGLGVKALWLTPIQLSDSYHGYDITDYEKVDPKFGSANSPHVVDGVVTEESALEDYKDLLKAAKDHGIKVVMDLVLNHTSTANNWFTSSANLDKEYRGYYQWGNHKTQSQYINEDKYWYPYGDHDYSYYAKFGSAMPELNYSYQATREAVEKMSAYWVDLGVSGFRLDAVKHIYMLDEATVAEGDTTVIDEPTEGGKVVSYSSNLTKNLHFFKELKSEVAKRTGKDVFFVGENFDGHAYHVAPYYEAFDSMFDFYAYFNITSGAATGRRGTTSAFGTVGGWMSKGNPDQVPSDGRFHKGSGDNGGSDFDLADNSIWDFVHVNETYNRYRKKGGGNSSVALGGAFTSNHDIARVINRIAGTGTAQGLQAQGTITTTNYADFERSAMCAKIAEVLLPGVTWVYYGDEIGMTGNFPTGKTADSDYSDLYYRQPMKWATSGNEKGDANGTTDYYVTGSKMKVEWDEVNKSTTVKGALEQQADPTSDYNILANFIKAKNADPTKLVTGDIAAGNWVYGNLAANTLMFSRGGDQYRVVVNFSSQDAQINNDRPFENYDPVVAYNGATTTSIPAFSAILMKHK